MRKPVLRSTPDKETHNTNPSFHSGPLVRPDHEHKPTASLPRWVKGLLIIFIILFLMFVIMHLTGNGFGSHMNLSVIEYGVHQL